jgi:hypothetical protein
MHTNRLTLSLITQQDLLLDEWHMCTLLIKQEAKERCNRGRRGHDYSTGSG